MTEEAKPMACSSAIVIEKNGVPYRYHAGWPDYGVQESSFRMSFEETMMHMAIQRKALEERKGDKR